MTVLWEEEGIRVHHLELEGNAQEASRWLDPSELERLARIRTAAGRRQFLFGRAGLRRLLCRRLDCPPDRLRLEGGPAEKPRALMEGRPSSLGLGVSHSGRHALIALGWGKELGVDLEERRPRRRLEALIGRSLRGGERRLLLRAAGAERLRLFYRCWTLKEALLKARGSGLSLPPSSFELPGGILAGSPEGILRLPGETGPGWRLRDLGEPRFAAALAWREG